MRCKGKWDEAKDNVRECIFVANQGKEFCTYHAAHGKEIKVFLNKEEVPEEEELTYCYCTCVVCDSCEGE